uniref:Uncharacterized protein n=1 Tax=Picea sitchensis TaxID=3332 RepID=A9NMC2_PICSI|nr:unknown [Picea sitchensis]
MDYMNCILGPVSGLHRAFIFLIHVNCIASQDVMKATRSQLDRELQMEDVFRLEDMPSYSLLSQ